MCSYLVLLTGFVSAECFRWEVFFCCTFCYLFVCKVGKLPLKKSSLLLMPSLHLLFKGGKESCGGGKEGAHVTRRFGDTSLPLLLSHTPRSSGVSGSPSVTPHWSDFHYSLFPDLVGCISLCKHSPLGLWNPSSIYISIEREKDKNSQETSPQIAFVVCFWLRKTGMGWGRFRMWSCQ